METKKNILIVGGSGTVGRKIAENLAPDFPDRVVIAARNLEKASQVASGLGHGVRAQYVDVTQRQSVEQAMEGVGTVVSCVIQPDLPHMLLAAVAHGCAYTDIAPLSVRRPPTSKALEEEATANGARIILGAGMIPGISNVFARMGADCVGRVDVVESTCLLSLGDEFGTDSRSFIAEELITPFKTTVQDETTLLWPFTGARRIEFSQPVGQVRAYYFPFSDQVYYPATLGAHTAVGRIALLPQWVPVLLALVLPLARKRVKTRHAGASGGLGGLMEWLKRRYVGLDWWGVHVKVQGNGGTYRVSVQGHGQARATALSASAFVRAFLEGGVNRPGIWTADQVIPVQPFLARLASHGLQPVYSYDTHGSAPLPEPGEK